MIVVSGICILWGLVILGDANIRFRRDRYSMQLETAVQAHNAEEVRRLLDKGADPDARNVTSPRTGVFEILRSQLMPHPPERSPTFLVIACQENDEDIAHVLIEKGASVDPQSLSAQTPLGAAAAVGNRHLVDLLLAHGARPNRQEENGMTALIYGSSSDAIVQDLLKSGADPTIKTITGYSPVIAALQSGNMHSVKRLIDAGATLRGVPISVSTYGGNIGPDIIALLVHSGADLQSRNNKGETALFQFSRPESDIASLRLLLAAGIPVNAQDEKGRTALMNAVGNVEYDGQPGNLDIVKLLLRHGAMPGIRDKNGHDASWHATIGIRTNNGGGEQQRAIVDMLKSAIR